MSETYVYLQCVKDRSKLRVRIVTDGYYNDANCQFPRDLRKDGRFFRVKAKYIKLSMLNNKYFYCVKNKNEIEIVKTAPDESIKPTKIYEDVEQEICMICYDNKKEAIFSPCGHFYTCNSCSVKCETCPICRQAVSCILDKKDLL